MHIRFWGTRGSLAKPGTTTLRYGGNTSCVEVRLNDGTLLVLDCGTGAHGLGQALLAELPLRGHVLISHTHWDHIQGFPFFAPLFIPGNEWDVYAPGGLSGRLEDTLAGQMEYAYFPVTLAELGAEIRYHALSEGSFDIGGARVTARYLNHPAPTLGYRLAAGGTVFVYATDHEPHSRHMDERTHLPMHEEDRRHVEFLSRADLVLHDAQYTMDEYAKKVGWGHTPAERATELAVAAGVKRLALFHHDPLRADDALDEVVAKCREIAVARQSALEVFAAAEGESLQLQETTGQGLRHAPERAAAPVALKPAEATVLIADDEAWAIRVISAALRSDGYRILTADDGEAALEIARAERPTLILSDWEMPRRSGVELCRALRASQDPALRAVPVVLVTAKRLEPADVTTAFEAGVTDYMTKPFTPQNIRSRVQAWLLRTQAGAGPADAPADTDGGSEAGRS
ncbi:MAG: response regulator [Armatimonadetes bacterium]|nr:response regulator [Armatimonadota bacterium]